MNGVLFQAYMHTTIILPQCMKKLLVLLQQTQFYIETQLMKTPRG